MVTACYENAFVDVIVYRRIRGTGFLFMEPLPEFTVVIPAYNEAQRIGPTLEAVSAYLEAVAISYEVIVVSDGSVDSTDEIVRRYSQRNERIRLLSYQPNKGKGHAVRTGMLEARAPAVLMTDADLATPIEDMRKLREAAAEGFDVVVGSRALDDSTIIGWRPWYRVLSGKVFNMIIRLLAVPAIRDTQCGFKYFHGGSAKRIFSIARLDGFGYDVEVLYLARKLGLRIAEIGVHWNNSPATKVSVLKHTAPMLLEVIKVRLNDLKGRYAGPHTND
jgi:dolichyl-phosphate beta-glucosyltransferase